MKSFYKLLKILISIILIPILIGSFLTLIKVFNTATNAGTISTMILLGITSWIFIFLIFPEPKWFYVFGHESTHAMWSFLFGGKLKRFRVGSNGGHVSITKSNFLVTLAPYFFPFYTVLIFVLYAVGKLFWDLSKYINIFYILIGFTYAFHITLTYKILKIKQPDIKKEGLIFSIIIILLGNIIILLVGISLITNKTTIIEILNYIFNNSQGIYQYIFNNLFFL